MSLSVVDEGEDEDFVVVVMGLPQRGSPGRMESVGSWVALVQSVVGSGMRAAAGEVAADAVVAAAVAVVPVALAA